MNTSFFISWRYLFAKRKQVFISVISVISILGVALGVAALIVTLSVMNGFQTDIKKKIVSVNPHIIVVDPRNEEILEYEKLEDTISVIKEVEGVAPFVYGQGMLKNGRQSDGVVLKGISAQEINVTSVFDKIKHGSFLTKDIKDVVIGNELAKKLDAYVGDEIVFISPGASITSFGKVPRWTKLNVVGIIETGMYEYDAHLALVNIETAQSVFEIGKGITGLGVRIKNMYDADMVSKRIMTRLDNKVWTKTWLRTNSSLFAALKLEKMVMFIILILIIIVASFGIISSLMLMTMEKTRDIGILKAMGLNQNKVSRIFMYEGLCIGFIGTFMGVVLGLGLVYILDKYKFIDLPADIYYLTTLPVQVRWMDISLIIVCSLIISLISTLYPAYKAGKLDPSVALRYE
ncbi:MAG: lipoprotein-releasing ABC transporter permease subunit [Elusimicrobiota bacterium]